MAAPCELVVDSKEIHVVVRSWHRLLSLSNGFSIPLAATVDVLVRPPSVRESWKTFLPSEFKIGSWIPGVYRAGSFRPLGRKPIRSTSWWLVRNPGETIELRLSGFKYDRVIVEVDDPDETALRIREAIGGGSLT